MPLSKTSLEDAASSGFLMREVMSFGVRRLAAIIEPFYPKPERAGHPLVGVERTLRILCRS